MTLSVLALDYDGTLARHDGLETSVRQAIAAVRHSGITVLLVTGRILGELRRVAGDLHFVDGVVAENGAVVHFPDSGYTTLLAPVIPAHFLTELGRRRIPVHRGECLVDTDAAEGGRLLEAIRALELPLALVFNRSRVMTLPQGISKATGLRAALGILRLSPRNMLAIGDAENDHEMLRLAEVGAAVEWGSAVLRADADLVVSGSGPADIARYLLSLAEGGRLPQPSRARRRLDLGYTEDGRAFALDVRGRNVLVAGDARSGKSWVAGLLCEQLVLHGYCVCVLDPEGDYRPLEVLPGVTVLGGEDPPPTPRELQRTLRYPDRSVVIDLSRLPRDRTIEYIRGALPALNTLRRRTGLPHRIVVDEAHYFLHGPQGIALLDLERNGYTLVTYRASQLPAEVLAAAEVVIVTCQSDPDEVHALRRRCGAGEGDDGLWRQRLGHLPIGQAVALPVTEEAGGDVGLFHIGRRLTAHVRHRAKYVDMPVSEQHAFVFEGGPGRRARTLREFVDALQDLPEAALAGHLHRHDFSRWLRDVFGDHALAEELRRHEARHIAGSDRETVPEIAGAIRARYDLTDDAASAE
jgi:hydroxymethylpyrimidine pyrophosphatase-like HAD family hydrolase